MKKVEKIREGLEGRGKELEQQQEKMLRHAQVAEAWADDVEKALTVVRSALANGVDWQDLEDLVEAEKANGNPVASLIHALHLEKNKVVLGLMDADGEMQEVEMDVMLSAHGNARLMYEAKKTARVKELKTLEAAAKVLKVAEVQAQKSLKQQAQKRTLQVTRKVNWFEKFNWFISTEDYLVISGKDAQQNDLVVKKYLRPGDIYVHADLHGASSCVVRNKDTSGKRAVSPLALEEAGCMTVCRSGAWTAKMVTSAWWVYADQVSKTAPTGEYLVTGSFMIRGRKHFLPPRSLEMGLALLFRLDDSSLANHLGERKERTNAEDEKEENGGGGREVEEAGTDGGAENIRAKALAALAGGGGGAGSRGGARATENGDSAPAQGGGWEGGGAKADRLTPPSCRNNLKKISAPRGQRGKLKRMKKKYGDQDDEDRQLAMEALGVAKKPKDGKGKGKGSRGTGTDGGNTKDGRRATAAEKAAEKNLQKMREDTAAALKLLHPQVQQRLRQLEEGAKNKGIKAGEMDAFEVRALARFSVGDAMEILTRFGEADLRRVRNRSGFLAGIMRKFGTRTQGDKNDPNPNPNPELVSAVPGDGEKEGGRASAAPSGRSSKPAGVLEGSVGDGVNGEGGRGDGDGGGGSGGETESKGQGGQSLQEEEAREGEVEKGDMDDKVAKWEEEEGGGGKVDREGEGEEEEGNESDQEAKGESEKISRSAWNRKEEEEMQRMLEEEGLEDETAAAAASELDRLTGKPLEEDVLLNAVAVCAPYMTLRDYKYKVKLTPGTQKRGKASKQAIELFTRAKDCTTSHRSLMKAISDNELVAVMIGDVKISTPGITQVNQAKKKDKKQKARVAGKASKQVKAKGGKGK
ncbi:unnamed protein product [Discosporangium mesarthrocarpum]